MFGGIGITEILIVLVIALIIFGPKRLPELGKALGSSLREFKSATKELQEETNEIEEHVKENQDSKGSNHTSDKQ